MTRSTRLPRAPRSPRPVRAGRRRGFSLIELLIVVAILSALVGVAVPMFRSYVRDGQTAKARQDLEVLRSSIVRWEFQQRSFMGGGSLDPLLGGVMQEIPRDPWGNAYFIDGNLGVIGTFGEDGVQFGHDQGEDLFLQYKTYMVPLKATLEGGYGPQLVGSRVTLQVSKPFRVIDPDVVPSEVVFLLPSEGALPVPLAYYGYTYDPVRSRPTAGLLVLQIDAGATVPPALANIPVTEGTVLTFSNSVISIQELPAPVAETGLEDPSPYMWGARPSILANGTWDGPVLRR